MIISFHYLINEHVELLSDKTTCLMFEPKVIDLISPSLSCSLVDELNAFLHLGYTPLWANSNQISHSPRVILISVSFSWDGPRMLWTLIEMQRNRSLEHILQDQVKEENHSLQMPSLINRILFYLLKRKIPLLINKQSKIIYREWDIATN